MFKNKKAFTLIELIVVMAVVGILVLLAMPKFMGYTQKAKLTEIKANTKQLEDASERYYMQKQEWPRLSDTSYTKTEIESFAKEIKNKTGQAITLDTDGAYYEIDYDKLKKYIQKPKDEIHYIIQNPVGEVYYLDDLTDVGKSTLYEGSPESEEGETNNKPTAVITMTPDQALTTTTTITWSSTNSTDPDGDEITNAEWQGKQNIYTTEGNYTVQLRVQDEHGVWSDWVSKEFYVMNSDGVAKIIANYIYTVALLNDGTVKTWGYNGDGQLGIGNTASQNLPVTVSGLTNVKEIFALTNHTFALLNNGTVKGWGYNGLGELGTGNTTPQYSPIEIPSLTNVKEIAGGQYYTIALLNDGTVKAWGQNQYGQLGIGNTTTQNSPVIMPDSTNINKIVAGAFHTVALLDDGTVKAWGYNGDGQLGIGNMTQQNSPVIISGLTDVKQITAGSYHTAILLNDGTVKVWGRNNLGQLGIGNTTQQNSPVILEIN